MKLYRLKIATPLYTRWVSKRASCAAVAKAMVQSRKVQVLEVVEG